MDYRGQTVTEMLRQLRDLTGKLYEILLPEIMSYEMLQADIEKKRSEMAQIEAQKATARVEIENAKQTAESIKNMAKDEAQIIIQNGKVAMIERLEKANALLASVEQFVPEMDKKRYLSMRKEAEKLAEKAA